MQFFPNYRITLTCHLSPPHRWSVSESVGVGCQRAPIDRIRYPVWTSYQVYITDLHDNTWKQERCQNEEQRDEDEPPHFMCYIRNKKGVDTLTFRHVGRCPRQNFKDKVGAGGPICLRFSWRRSEWWAPQARFFRFSI